MTKSKKGKTTPKKAAITGWLAKPKSVSAFGNPCHRKKLEMMRPPCPIKQLLATKTVINSRPSPQGIKPVQEHVTCKPPVRVSESAMVAPSCPSTSHSLLKYAEAWPSRDLPSVRDIVAYRRSVPVSATSAEVGQLAGVKFDWHNKVTVTAVQGVVAGHDHARRTLLNELGQLVAGPYDLGCSMW